MPETLRPIADAIARVRIVPDAPTSVPATTSSTLPSTRPDAATARPVNALSSEITIGTSAPPTGSTSSTPAASPSASSTTASHAGSGDDHGDGRADRRQQHQRP